MKVILIDDEQLAIQYLESLLREIPNIEIAATFTDPEQALQQLPNLDFNVLFLDMEMGKIHGLEFAEKIISKNADIIIIFVTAYPQYALGAFEVNAIDYLLKPIEKERLEIAVNKARERIMLFNMKKEDELKRENKLYVKTFGCFRLLDFNNEIVKWRTRKAKELFVYLWEHENYPVHKERVIDELWPGIDIERATTLLHTTVYQLRQTCKKIGIDNAVKYANNQYILMLETNSDINEIEEIYRKQLSYENIENALDLYVGDYLEEDGYQWTISTQQRHAQLLLTYLEKAVTTFLHKDNDLILIERCLEKMIQLNPTNEKYIKRLSKLYGQSGKIEQLIKLTESIKTTFETELKITIPSEVKKVWNKFIN